MDEDAGGVDHAPEAAELTFDPTGDANGQRGEATFEDPVVWGFEPRVADIGQNELPERIELVPRLDRHDGPSV